MKKSKRSTLTPEGEGGHFAATAERYASSRIKSLGKNITRSRRYFAVEGIHDLRVEMKRIRAFFDLMKVIMPALRTEKQIDTLRPLFKKAGQLRDIDIQQAIVISGLVKYELSEYYNYLKKQELVLRPDFTEACDSFDRHLLKAVLKKFHAALQEQPNERIELKVEKYAEKKFQRMLALLKRKKQTNVGLHEIRKLAKLARYTLDVWIREHKSAHKLNTMVNHLKAIASCLGEWHDINVLAESLRSYLDHDAPNQLFDRTAYEAFLKELAVQSKRKLTRYEHMRKILASDIPKLRFV